MKKRLLELIKQEKKIALVKYADGLAVYVFTGENTYCNYCFQNNSGILEHSENDVDIYNSEIPHIIKSLETIQVVHTDDRMEHAHD